MNCMFQGGGKGNNAVIIPAVSYTFTNITIQNSASGGIWTYDTITGSGFNISNCTQGITSNGGLNINNSIIQYSNYGINAGAADYNIMNTQFIGNNYGVYTSSNCNSISMVGSLFLKNTYPIQLHYVYDDFTLQNCILDNSTYYSEGYIQFEQQWSLG